MTTLAGYRHKSLWFASFFGQCPGYRHHPRFRHGGKLCAFGHAPVFSSLSRRSACSLLSTTAAGIAGLGVVAAAAYAGLMSGSSGRELTRSGMAKFIKGDVEGSMADFNNAWHTEPSLRPYLWQRGLSAYYLEQYEVGAQQFKDDVAVNPNDTEESIWAFLCEARMSSPTAARDNFLQVGRDPRPIMRAAYECFRQGTSPDQILSAAGQDQQGHDRFYALLYAGLWHEAEGNMAEAQANITAAAATQYAQQSGDYMAALARVHYQRRNWTMR